MQKIDIPKNFNCDNHILCEGCSLLHLASCSENHKYRGKTIYICDKDEIVDDFLRLTSTLCAFQGEKVYEWMMPDMKKFLKKYGFDMSPTEEDKKIIDKIKKLEAKLGYKND